MIRIELTFLTGRFHATPPDHHANEGLVEWPPSPWRICRALLATGFRTAFWPSDRVPPTAQALVRDLASAPPTYRLPPAPTLGHLRHYVPAPTTARLLLDAFVVLRPEDRVEIRWPVDLPANSRNLLEALVPELGYLGRSESLVSARLLSDLDPDTPGYDAEPTTMDAPPPRGSQAIELLAPMRPSSFFRWRAEAIGELEKDALRAGRSPSAARRRAEGIFPADLVAALLIETDARHAQRWSAPPGSERIPYDLPNAAVPGEAARRPATIGRAPEGREGPFMAGTRLASFRLSPHRPLAALLTVTEGIHRQLASHPLSARVDVRARLLGKSAAGQPLSGHRHLHLLPIARGRRLVGVLAYLPAGFSDEARDALLDCLGPPEEPAARARSNSPPPRAPDSPRGRSSLPSPGSGLEAPARAGFLPFPEAMLGPARRWRSLSPFLLVRHPRRRRDTPESQVRLELTRRGLPEPVELWIWDDHRARAAGFFAFRRVRQNPHPPPTERPYGVSLAFAEPVQGPLALGYGAHFGLGSFVVDDTQHPT